MRLRPVRSILALVGALAAPPAMANDERTAFVEANVLAIFYHELGHAVIDLLDLPVLGQEEDAADVMAVLLIDRTFEEEDARDLAYHSAFGFLDADVAVDGDADEPDYWDVHGPDEQRYYNHVCLFYGADPEGRAELARELDLPDERAETCPEEFEIAADSWENALAELEAEVGEPTLILAEGRGPATDPAAALLDRTLREEIAELNMLLAFPEPVRVLIEPCGEANAYYDPADVTVTLCTEFVPYLERVFDAVSE